MEVKNHLALKKKRELLLAGGNKRKMSLRKNLTLHHSDCSLDITQLFDSPLMLEELDKKVANVSCSTVVINNENEEICSSLNEDIAVKEVNRKLPKRKCLNVPKIKKKKSDSRLDEQIKDETEPKAAQSVENKVPIFERKREQNALKESPEPIFQVKSPIELEFTDKSVKIAQATQIYDFEEELPFEEDLALNRPRDIKVVELPSVDYEDEAQMKREPTPELILSDSDEDAIDQLMFNIMDIKVGPNAFEKDFIDSMQPGDITEFTSEYSNEADLKEDEQDSDEKVQKKKSHKVKKFIKRYPQCKICSKVFSNYSLLKKHRETHDGERPYPCLECNENHSTLDRLLAHLRTHQGKRPYLCRKCNKGFKSLKALDKHKPVHVLKKAAPKEKSFKCSVCSKEFRKLCDLERHTRVHTGEKPSVCNICNRRFQQAHNLNKHLLIHTKEKPFECDICHKKFGRNDVLNRHLLTHSVKKPNSCDICMKSFIRISQLAAHKVKYHSENSTSS